MDIIIQIDIEDFSYDKEGKEMKKKLAILLSLAMALTFALAACGGGGSEDLSDSKYVGSWIADSLSFAGESGEMEATYTLTLNGD